MLAGIFSYTRETLRGNNKPNKVTWLLWSIAPLIGVAAALSDGVRLAALPTLVTGIAPLVVFAASFVNKNAYWKLEWSDYVCGFFSLLALLIWGITKEPVLAITFAIVSDALAALPTMIKSWKFPETESSEAYTTAAFGNATSFFALKTGSFAEVAFPVYLVAVNVLIVVALYRKKFLKQPGVLAPDALPEEMQALAQEIAKQASQEAALRYTYEALGKKYRGYRVLTFLRMDRLFITDIGTLWKKQGFLHCHHMNYLLRTLLVASGQFAPEDIDVCWTQIWFFSPHQYLVATLKNGEKRAIDLWARAYGIPFGKHAHGFQGGSFLAKIGE